MLVAGRVASIAYYLCDHRLALARARLVRARVCSVGWYRR